MNKQWYFGEFGGRFIPETLYAPVEELSRACATYGRSAAFRRELAALQSSFIGRPTPLLFARRFSEHIGARVFLKREDLCHTGAHKINNTVGQALLARTMGKRRVIAETGAGQHGVATATVCALFGLQCTVYMGAEDMERQELNVRRMRLLGAEVVPVSAGSRTLKDAINECLRDWATNVRTTYYLIGTVMGPHPYPRMVRDFQSVIGSEARRQIIRAAGRLPDYLVACVGGGSNAMGLFAPFFSDRAVRMIGVEAAGCGLSTGRHAATIARGKPGILHGMRTYVLEDRHGQILPTHSISAGLDYPGVGPEHAYYHAIGRARYVTCTDAQALEGFDALSRLEGIVPALESAHALGYLIAARRRFKPSDVIVVCLSGRGDKDLSIVGGRR